VELEFFYYGGNFDWRLFNDQNNENILEKLDKYHGEGFIQDNYCIEPQCLKLIIFDDWGKEDGDYVDYDYDTDYMDYDNCRETFDKNSSFKFTYDSEVVFAKNDICDYARSEAITSNLFGC